MCVVKSLRIRNGLHQIFPKLASWRKYSKSSSENMILLQLMWYRQHPGVSYVFGIFETHFSLSCAGTATSQKYFSCKTSAGT